MPDQKRIDDRAFFEMLDEAELERLDRTKGNFPWEQRLHGEDRWAAEERIREIYAALKLAPPKMSWSSSPAALWSAISMLKTFGMKQALIDTLVPAKGLVSIEGEAKRSLLSAILNDDLLVNMGAPIAPMLRWSLWNSPPRSHQAIHDADKLITHAARASDALSRSGSPAGWSNAVIYPVMHSEGSGHLAANAFCILPYAKVVWFCLPPMYVKTDPHGNLHCEDGPAIRWADGYELFKVYEPPPDPDEERLRLEAEFGRPNPDNPTVKLLNEAVGGLIKKRLEGK